jgi:MFS family permease
VIAGLLMMKVPPRPPRHAHRSAWRDTVDGFRFVAKTAPIHSLLILLGVLSFAAMPYSVLMPVFAESILRAGPKGLGLLMGASGVGALGGALALASRRSVRGLGRWVAVSAAATGVALIAFSFSRTFWLSALLLVPVGGALMVEMAASNTLLQAMVPDRLRGRVMAFYSMMFMGMAPFGALSAGWIAERRGAPMTVALGGLVCLAAAAVFSLRLPKIRNEARELIVAQEMAGGDPPAEMTGSNLSVD